MSLPSTSSPFPPLPVSKVTLPSTPLTTTALAYSKQHTSPSTVNHTLRSAAFALIITRKNPAFSSIDPETLTLGILFHDLGWATTKSLVSADKRFEVDGANLAGDFLAEYLAAHDAETQKWDHHRVQLIWDAIALHTSPSIAMHSPQSTVAATTMGISADFFGPNFPGGLISVEEYKEVVGAFPRLGFAESLKEIMCGFCREKPQVTYDNFVGEFGLRYVEGYEEGWKQNQSFDRLMGGLKACEEWE